MESWLIGVLATVGALLYNAWGFFTAFAKTKDTPILEVWSPIKTVLTIVPSLAAAFVAAFLGQLEVASPGNAVAVVIAGFGLAAAGSKLGIDSFFDVKEPAGKKR